MFKVNDAVLRNRKILYIFITYLNIALVVGGIKCMQRSSKTIQNAGCVHNVHIVLIFRTQNFTFSSHLVNTRDLYINMIKILDRYRRLHECSMIIRKNIYHLKFNVPAG